MGRALTGRTCLMLQGQGLGAGRCLPCFLYQHKLLLLLLMAFFLTCSCSLANFPLSLSMFLTLFSLLLLLQPSKVAEFVLYPQTMSLQVRIILSGRQPRRRRYKKSPLPSPSHLKAGHEFKRCAPTPALSTRKDRVACRR